ncbi:hypothetical protein AVEN_270085-1 [Araneus ventricosus]|uniref:Uncharacterized protein n=1 Tax=Araneus ventricosus TaxID=182803 RepID=A0A4Y2LGX5_ARAVE|nr:hypothetical protein AVEN_270085-1 [Araneus ventricosus]
MIPGPKTEVHRRSIVYWTSCMLNHTSSKGKCPPAGMVKKYPHWLSLPKKVVRPREDQRGESHPTSMWRTGFIMYNKMMQALPEQGQ